MAGATIFFIWGFVKEACTISLASTAVLNRARYRDTRSVAAAAAIKLHETAY